MKSVLVWLKGDIFYDRVTNAICNNCSIIKKKFNLTIDFNIIFNLNNII